MFKLLFGRGYVVKIDGVRVGKVLADGVPIPNLNARTALLKYYFDKGDNGQKLIDNLYYNENKNLHQLEISLPPAGLNWEYEGEIVKVAKIEYESEISDYKLKNDNILTVEVKLNLCGKLQYTRGEGDEQLIVTRDLSRN